MFEEGLRTDGISPCSVRHHRHRAGVGRHDGCRAAVGRNDGHDAEQLVGDDDNHQTSHDALHMYQYGEVDDDDGHDQPTCSDPPMVEAKLGKPLKHSGIREGDHVYFQCRCFSLVFSQK